MRSRLIVVGAALSMCLALAPPAHAYHSVGTGLHYSETYRANLRLQRGARAIVTFTRYSGAAASVAPSYSPMPSASATPHMYHACVTIYKRSSPYYPSVYRCGEPEVARYSFDPQMNAMRLQFDLLDDWYYYSWHSSSFDTLPTSVNLTIRGRGPVRSGIPSANASTYGAYASKADTRQATTSGTIAAPGVGSRRVRSHSPRRGMVSRGVTVSQYPPYFP